MSLSPYALYSALTTDLAGILSTYPSTDFFDIKKKKVSWAGASVQQVASLALLNSILRKYCEGSSKAADAAALEVFLSSNARCKRETAIDVTEITELDTLCLGEFKKCYYDFFFTGSGDYWLDYETISRAIAVGPGSSILANGTSFYHKVGSSPLSGTSDQLLRLYLAEVSRCSLWQDAENLRRLHYGDFVKVIGNVLSYALKNSEISRSICTEPVLNMFFQKGIEFCFVRWLKIKFGIDLTDQQPKNQLLAREGSVSQTYGTIDLVSASNSIANVLMTEVTPKYVLGWLNLVRSPNTTLPNGDVVPLHMISSMGNAFTFPLQTIIFASVVVGVYRALDIKVIYPRGTELGNFSVFGDDIIVRREAYNSVVRILERLGFQVNNDKSFNEGDFRESCGADFWRGENVRGVYLDAVLTKHERYSLINRLNVWSCNHDVPLPTTIAFLIDGQKFNPVPPWESDTAGVKVPFELAGPRELVPGLDGSVFYERYLNKAKGLDLLAIGSRPLGTDPAYKPFRKTTGCGWVLRRPKKPTPLKSSGYIDNRTLYNGSAVILSAVREFLKDGRISFRMESALFQKRVGIAPCWDYVDMSHSSFTSEGWYRWNSTGAKINFGRC